MRSFRSTLKTIALCLSVAILIPACAADTDPVLDDSTTSEAAANIVTISARSFDQLANGERLTVNSLDKDSVFRFDVSQGEIDFSRIDIVCPNGQQMAMDAWLTKQQADGVDIQKMLARGFAVGSDQQASGAYMGIMEGTSSSMPGYGSQAASAAAMDCVIIVCSDGLIIIICVAD